MISLNISINVDLCRAASANTKNLMRTPDGKYLIQADSFLGAGSEGQIFAAISIRDSSPCSSYSNSSADEGNEEVAVKLINLGRFLGRGSSGGNCGNNQKCIDVNDSTFDISSVRKCNNNSSSISESCERCRSHYRRLIGIRHDNVIEVTDVQICDNVFYVVMEKCDRDLLMALTESTNQKYDENMAAYVMKQVMTGLDFCHSRGIFHGDLKPENLLLKGEFVKLTDFSIKIYEQDNFVSSSSYCR